jgi:citrate lyase subunit beta/citryl-CoA lyase
VFTPSAERIAAARKQTAAYEIAQANGQGAINVDGVMVDAASIRLSQGLLDQADLLGL